MEHISGVVTTGTSRVGPRRRSSPDFNPTRKFIVEIVNTDLGQVDTQRRYAQSK